MSRIHRRVSRTPCVPQFAPGLLIISAGFDAALGDVQGKMRMTPAGFVHLTRELLGLEGERARQTCTRAPLLSRAASRTQPRTANIRPPGCILAVTAPSRNDRNGERRNGATA